MDHALTGWTMIAAAAAAAAAGSLGWIATAIATAGRTAGRAGGRFEEARRAQLRAGDWFYQTLEPWIDELAGLTAGRFEKWESQLRRDLAAAALSLPWQAREYLALVLARAILAAALALVLVTYLAGPNGGVAAAAALLIGLPALQVRQIAQRATRRRRAIKRRLAAALELMSLLMEVGAGFQDALEAVARETAGHPLGDELERLLCNLEAGMPRKKALEELGGRLDDPDVGEFVYAVVQGEDLGTPLAAILRNQAEQMRQKRSQWAEKAAEEAQVAVVFPAMLIMVACLIIVVAPFVITAIVEFHQ